jgi:hypothetical protein
MIRSREDDSVWELGPFNGLVEEYGLSIVTSSSAVACRLLSFLPKNNAAVDCKLSPREGCLCEEVLGESGGQLGLWAVFARERGAVVVVVGLGCGDESLSGKGGDAPVAAPRNLRTPFI